MPLMTPEPNQPFQLADNESVLHSQVLGENDLHKQMQLEINSPAELHRIFSDFARMSEQLAASYEFLETKVTELTDQLDVVSNAMEPDC